MAFRLAKKTGNTKVTAMPLGLDTPSTIGIALVVLGPAFIGLKAEGLGEHDAAMMTWYIGMATMVVIGIIKVLFSFIGQWVQRVVPQAGLLGSLAGIGLALIGLVPLVDIFSMPVVGLISLGLIFYSLVARIKLPRNFPGVLASILIGTFLYYLLGPTGWMGGTFSGVPAMDRHFGLPIPTFGFMEGLSHAWKYMPIAIPFGLLTVVGGINVTESARVAGDNFNTRTILLTEAIATLVAGLCGGVAQSTPYIGQPAVQTHGITRRLYVTDGDLYRSWRSPRLCFVLCRVDSTSGARTDFDFCRDGYRGAILPRVPCAPCARCSVCILPDHCTAAFNKVHKPGYRTS